MHSDTVTTLVRKTPPEHLRERMRDAYRDTGYSLADHGQRVAGVALVIAAEWGFTSATNTGFLEDLRLAGEFHDIGKIMVAEDVRLSTTTFNDAERRVMERHTEFGAAILREAGMPEAVIDAALYHHVRYAGGGYPDTMLSGDAIPFSARIIAVADYFAARTEDRPHRAGHPVADVWADLLENRGVWFDPHIVDTFERTAFLDEARRAGCVPDPSRFIGGFGYNRSNGIAA